MNKHYRKEAFYKHLFVNISLANLFAHCCSTLLFINIHQNKNKKQLKFVIYEIIKYNYNKFCCRSDNHCL